MKEIELVNKRKEREKHFLREDGICIARIYDRDVHCLKNGKYVDIDQATKKEKTRANINNNNIYDTYIFPGDTNITRHDKEYLKAGVERVNNNDIINRTLIKFDLPTLSTGDEVIYATLNLYGYRTTTEYPREYYATIHRITEDWSESTANWATMNDKYDSHVESLFVGSRSPIINNVINLYGNTYDGNITNLVKRWYKDTPNYGVMIKSLKEEYVDDDYLEFYSKDNTYGDDNNPKPVFELEYRNQNGLESYLNYQSQTFADGQTYVNTYNGNLTSVFNVGHTIGGNLPVSISLIYNTNDVILGNSTKFGIGYKLSLEQTITELQIENTNYLSYVDEDGTIHYFKESNETNIYNDEDGLNLTIEKENNKCIMKDDDGNSMEFTKISDTYYLTSIRDVDNNTITITLGNNNEITSVTDSNNNSVSFTYNSNNTVITSPDFTTTLIYTNNKLSELSTINGSTIFTYDSNDLIESITDVNGLKVEYEYYSNTPHKARKVTQYGLNNTIGEYFSLDYGFDITKIIDHKGRCSTLIFNDYGNLLSINSSSSEDDIDKAYSISNEVGTVNNKKNRITSSSIPIKAIRNLLTNTSFEDNSIIFTPSANITTSISDDCYNSGYKSLKCIATSNAYISTNVGISKGEDYTFSGYIKSTSNYSISLSYIDSNNIEQEELVSCNLSNDFEREDVSIYYPEDATSNLIIKIIMNDSGTLYLDDIQLEVGKVANSYNAIENCNFRNGYSDWNVRAITFDESTIDVNDYISVVNFNNNQSSALKVEANPMNTFILEKTLPISGNEGDLYSFSFWYKNNGIPGYGPVCSTNVMMYFKPVGSDAEYCIPISEDLNVNRDKWQYFTYRSHAIENYESIRLVVMIAREANDFYITNLSFNKEVTSGDYKYDSHGNLISITDQSNNTNSFKYNGDNQLIKTTNTQGQGFIYEYDKNKKSRVINSISSNGISNKITYNSYGNPIITRVAKKYNNTLSNGLYNIRNSGTNKYLKAELSLVLLEENECSNTIWKLEQNNDYYKIIYNNNDNYSISCNNGVITLDDSNINNLFILEKNDNGSYHIKFEDTTSTEGTVIRFLTANGTTIEANEFIEDSSDIEFYIELDNNLFMENSANYTNDNRFVSDVTDTTLKKSIYNNNSTNGLLTSTTDPKNITTNFTYNNKNQCTKISQGSIDINYTYNNKNLLSKINQGNKDYNFTYDDFLNLTSVNLNNTYTLSTNEYESNNGNLLRTTYGNNQTISFNYDEFDRISNITKMDDIYKYHYDNNGNVYKVESNDALQKFLYDKSNRLYQYKNNDFKVKYTYDSENNIINKNYYLNNFSNSQNNIFDDYKLVSTTLDNNTTINYGYDELLRNTSKSINNIINTNVEFLSNGKRTSDIIKKYIINNDIYKYIYDDVFNITDIYLNDTLIKHYEYDNYNELVEEFNYDLGNKYTYVYDLSGNLTKKTLINLVNNAIIKEYNYSYGNSNWEDQLTTFDNETITYDNLGNMISFDGANYTWKNGVELATYSNNDTNTYVSYKYNERGIRIYKSVNGTDVYYHVLGNNILYESRFGNIIYYLYDSDGIVGFDYNSTRYYYVKNMEDDIIGIVDSNGNRLVSYIYDSWGNILSIKDNNNQEISQEDYTHIANINPFRYKSYYYDVETRLYYLNHRYYNPRINRFISPDLIIGSNQDILSYNLYAYVGNNPVNNGDKDGLKKKKKTSSNKKKKSISIQSVIVGVLITAFLISNKKSQIKGKIYGGFAKTIDNISNAINNAFYVDIGGGFGYKSGNNNIGALITKTTGYEISNQELKPYTSTSYGGNIKEFGINREIRNYDNTNNPMTLPTEIYNSSNTAKTTTVSITKSFIEISKNEVDDNLFVGLSVDSTDFTFTGGSYFIIKIGFNIDVSWLPGYKNY